MHISKMGVFLAPTVTPISTIIHYYILEQALILKKHFA